MISLNSRMDSLELEFAKKTKENEELEDRISVLKEKEKAAEQKSTMWFIIAISLLVLCVFILIFHLTRLNKKNKLLHFTFHELHHRKANNLRMVSAFLGLQAEGLEDRSAKMALHEAKNRMAAIGLIHVKLYKKKTQTMVNMTDYIQDLLKSLEKVYKYKKNFLKVEVSTEDLKLDGDTATHFGVLINELVTNAFKHAFKDNPEPVLGIILRKESLDTAYLEIRDNGKGLMSEINPNKPNTFGMKVIRLMVEIN